MSKKFLVAQVDFDYPDNEIERKIIEAAGGELISAHLSEPDEIVNFCKDADALIVQYAQITKEILQQLPNCKIVSRYGIGIDNVDVHGAKELGIFVSNNPQYCIDEVSDHAFGMMMTLLRQISHGTDHIRKGIWDFTKLTPIKACSETIVGIFGFGNIGRRFAKKAKVFGFKCIAYDPYVEDSVFIEEQVEQVSFDQLLSKSDCITIHCALTPKTTNIFSEVAFSKMKNGSYLVNTSRGPVVDIEALVFALQSNKIRGAALDVLSEEPPKSLKSIIDLPSLILTPHIAFYSETSIIELRTSITNQVVQVMNGETPTYAL